MDDNFLVTARSAERIDWNAGWRLRDEAVPGRLRGTVNLARARFGPRPEVIKVAAFDGAHLAHMRRETGPGRWRQRAVPKARARRIGAYPGAAAAAGAPSARASGRCG